jgi:hypothetical protein
MATGLSQTAAEETAVQTEPNVERVTFYETTSGPGLLIASRQESKLEPSIRRLTTVEHLQLKLADLGVEKGDITQSLTGAETNGFEHWDLANISKKELLLVGSDIEGMSPFEDPNNPMVRLWLVPVSLGPLPKAPKKVSNSDMINAHLKTRRTASILRLILDEVIPSVEGLSIAVGHAGTGFCVGRTKGKGIWIKEFSLNPLAWREGGEVLVEGSFVNLAATMSKDTLVIAAIDNFGAVKVFSKEFIVKDLKNVTPSERIILPATGNEEKKVVKEIVLTSSNKGAILGVLTDAGDKDEVYIYRNLANEKGWQLEKRIVLTRKASSLSILASEKDLIYCYISRSHEKTEIIHANIALF